MYEGNALFNDALNTFHINTTQTLNLSLTLTLNLTLKFKYIVDRVDILPNHQKWPDIYLTVKLIML